MLVFNLITWVRFDNVECETNVDHTGICYTNSECKALGGINAGSCAAGKHIGTGYKVGTSKLLL